MSKPPILNYRDQLVEERTRGVNRLHSELTRRHPGYQNEIRNLVSRRSLRRAAALLEAEASIETALLLRRLTSLHRLSSEIAALSVHIRRLVEQSRTSLIEIVGVGPLVAARILANVGDVQRIASESRLLLSMGPRQCRLQLARSSATASTAAVTGG